jgi:ArsR family transcriptional regulator, arsenate/arsenite/antimonite-responsive transcriptional repressor
MSDIFNAISDATRRQILGALAATPGQTVSELVSLTGEGQPTVSKHLKTLRDLNLVTVETAGQTRKYSLNAAPLAEVSAFLNQVDAPAGAATSGTTEVTAKAVVSAIESKLAVKLGEAGENVGNKVAEAVDWLGDQLNEQVLEKIDEDKLGRELGRRIADARFAAEKSAREAAAAAKAKLDEGLQAAKNRLKQQGPESD